LFSQHYVILCNKVLLKNRNVIVIKMEKIVLEDEDGKEVKMDVG